MNQMRNNIFNVLFFASIWGLTEGLLGTVIHQHIPHLSGLLLYPVGLFFMMQSYNVTKKRSAIFVTAVIAAVIKGLDFFLIPSNQSVTILIVSSILMEGLVATLCIPFLVNKENSFMKLMTFVIIASLGWRVIFAAYDTIFSPILFHVPAQCIQSTSRAINFFVTEGLISIIMITGLSYLVSDRKIIKDLNPVLSLGALSLAFIAEFALVG